VVEVFGQPRASPAACALGPIRQDREELSHSALDSARIIFGYFRLQALITMQTLMSVLHFQRVTRWGTPVLGAPLHSAPSYHVCGLSGQGRRVNVNQLHAVSIGANLCNRWTNSLLVVAMPRWATFRSPRPGLHVDNWPHRKDYNPGLGEYVLVIRICVI